MDKAKAQMYALLEEARQFLQGTLYVRRFAYVVVDDRWHVMVAKTSEGTDADQVASGWMSTNGPRPCVGMPVVHVMGSEEFILDPSALKERLS